MARHWSEFCGGNVTDRQGYALDKKADELGLGSGLMLIMKANGNLSSSKAQKKMAGSRIVARQMMDAAFAFEG
jgi:hypothetical protein